MSAPQTTRRIETITVSGAVTSSSAQGLGIDNPLAMRRGGNVEYYQADGLGSVTSLTGSTGQLTATYGYDSFGNTTPTEGIFNPYRYTAREQDPETDLYYYRARYYDPTIGRFISEDPITFFGGMNFFRYVANSPVSLKDPKGLENASLQEVINNWGKVGPTDSFRGYQFAGEALTAAVAWTKQHHFPVPESLHNGPPDAFRHCFWSCTMAKYLGEEVAETIADEHEKAGNRADPPQAHKEELMDRANNLIGRGAACEGKNCWDSCTDRYNQGRLFGLDAHPFR